MITLNSVTLSEDLIWDNEFDHTEVTQTIQRTVLGTSVISSFPKQAGKLINLKAVSSGNEYFGFFTRSQIQAFKVLEVNVTSVVFHYEGQNFDVIVQSGGVQVRPLLPRPNQEVTDLYTGTLILVTV